MNIRKKELETEFYELKCSMGDTTGTYPYGDWKLSEYLETIAAGEISDFDIKEYHAKRNEIRARINEIEELLETMTDD